MKRVGLLALLFLLSACVTAQDTPPVAAVEKAPCPDGAAEGWQRYLKAIPDVGTDAARPYLDCAVEGGHLQAMTALGTELTGAASTTADFEHGIAHLRKAAVAGEVRAQRVLAYRYEAGKNWVGRNAYLALFWYGVANKDDPFYRAAPKTAGLLEEFRDTLSEKSRKTLSRQIRDWQPGDQEPQSYVIDIVTTRLLEGRRSVTGHQTAFETERAIEYGLKAGLPDAGLLALAGPYKRGAKAARMQLIDDLIAQGSFLALGLKLETLKGENGNGAEVEAVALQALSRLGLDLRYSKESQITQIEQFWRSKNIDPLVRSIAEASPPERQILATLAALGACNDETLQFCIQTKATLEPFIAKPALDLLKFTSAYRECSSSTFVYRCMLNNGGTRALRDIIVNDTVDLGGRSV